jgi:hypothetical protein
MLLLVPTNAYALQEQIVTSVMKHAPVVGAAAAPPAAVAMLVLALVVSVLQPNLDFTLGLSGALPRLSRHGPSGGERPTTQPRLHAGLIWCASPPLSPWPLWW